jgi:hypothetical protein
LQEVLSSIAMEGGNNAVLTIRVTSFCIQQLRLEVYQHQKRKEAKAEVKEARVQQLE